MLCSREGWTKGRLCLVVEKKEGRTEDVRDHFSWDRNRLREHR